MEVEVGVLSAPSVHGLCVRKHLYRVYSVVLMGACVFSCNLHFWQSDRDILCATAATRKGVVTDTEI